MSILYPVTLLNVCISSKNLPLGFFGLSVEKIMPSANTYKLSTFPFFFSCLIDLAKGLSSALHRSSDSGCPYHVLDFGGKCFGFPPFNMMVVSLP